MYPACTLLQKLNVDILPSLDWMTCQSKVTGGLQLWVDSATQGERWDYIVHPTKSQYLVNILVEKLSSFLSNNRTTGWLGTESGHVTWSSHSVYQVIEIGPATLPDKFNKSLYIYTHTYLYIDIFIWDISKIFSVIDH